MHEPTHLHFSDLEIGIILEDDLKQHPNVSVVLRKWLLSVLQTFQKLAASIWVLTPVFTKK